MAGRGRPKLGMSLYDKYIKGKEDIIIADCRNGADNKGLCVRLGIGLTTFKSISSFPQLFYPLMTRQFFCDFHEKSEDFCVS